MKRINMQISGTEQIVKNRSTKSQLPFDKEAKAYNGVKTDFNKWFWNIWTPTCKRKINLSKDFISFTKIN
jgi:hypothetical protein